MDPIYFYIDWECLFQFLAVVIVVIAFALAYFGGSKASIKLFVDLWKVGNKIKDEEPPEEGDNEGYSLFNFGNSNEALNFIIRTKIL